MARMAGPSRLGGMRRFALLPAGVLALATVSVVWAGLGLPPPTEVLGSSAGEPGGPTGRTISIEGVEFVEIGPGSFRMGSRERYDPGDVPGRTTRGLRLGWGRPAHSNEMPEHVVTFRRSYFLARTEITD